MRPAQLRTSLSLGESANIRWRSFARVIPETRVQTEWFGYAGGWNHNYNWTLEDSPRGNAQNFHPVRYTVNFPDGRVETFRIVTWDPGYYRVRPGVDTPAQSSSAGVRERFLPLNTSTMLAYLILPDGGKVKFQATQHSSNGQYYYTYKATAIIDPHGLETSFTYEVVGNGLRRLTRVTEPAGRYLQFSYATANGPRISQVTEYIAGIARRAVQYYYSYTMLDRVLYYGNANWTARYQYTGSNTGQSLPPLLWTCDDPMYPGPMKRIGYEYKPGGPNDPNNPDGTRPVYGQILRERYWDGNSGHEGSGAIVSTLTVGESPNATWKRVETRGEGATRTFIYSGTGQINWAPDFMGHSAQLHYDATTKYVDYVVDRKGHRTDYTTNRITGNVTQIQFPLTQGDTPGQNQRPTVNYSYTNNYYLHTVQGENGQTKTITRDANNRVTRIDYPDGGYETFGYDASHLYQVSSHRMTTGGTETFAYDARHRLQYYSDPDHNNTNNPSITYYYDGLDRISGMVDALSHSTNFDHNDRGQVTVTTLPWINGVQYTISNLYNADGTLRSKTDELGHLTSYEYDDYRRLKSVTPPVRGSGDTGIYRALFYYGVNAWDAINDYRFTDFNVTYVVPPSTSTKKIKTVYDDNRRKQSMIVAPGTADEATTSYGYDNAGDLTTVTNPRNRSSTAVYDERNRPSEIHDPYNNITSFTYDTAGRRKTITRPNGQVITNASFDEMNRVLQQNVTQTPGPLAVTKYTYYPSGLLNTMTDPNNSTDDYIYTYDLTGRKSCVTFPADSNGNHSTEHFTYDTTGRLDTFKNRSGKTQTFSYDALNRITQSSWDDNGITPTVTFSYDAASRVTAINNTNANISRAYFDDNLLRQETESITGGSSKTVAYTYNADGNRANLTYPDYAAFAYTYTGRNQLKNVGPWATYTYDENGYTGDLTTCTLNNSTHTTYNYDPLDRVTWITHWLTSGVRGFNYGYDDVSVGNRKYIRRTGTTLGDKGDVFSYDLADQAIGVGLNVTTPQITPAPARSIFYDANGNRTTFRPYGPTDTYVTNNLNQYTSRNSNNATYNANGDMTITPELAGSRSTYSFDAQNRLTSAGKGNVTMYFNYDGLNRQVSRTVGGVTTYNVWDGWNLIEEYQSGGSVTAKYVYGAAGLIKELVNNQYYYQDGSGSTSHLADGSGNLKEWYRYDLQGAPFFYNPNDTQRSPNQSGFNVRHLFTGHQWHIDVDLYDLRNRFYSPDLGRFLQPDPIGFWAGNNLYRYCGNNSVTGWDPFGLQQNLKVDPNPQYLGSDPWMKMEGMTPDEYFENTSNLPDNNSSDGPNVEVGVGPPPDSGGNSGTGGPPGGFGGSGGSGGGSGLGRLGTGDGGPGGKTLANSQATIFIGKVLQSFNSQGGWKQTANALDSFAAFEVNLLLLGEGGVNWGLGRLVIGRGAIQTPYAIEVASTSLEARAAMAAARNGATLYRTGELGESMAGESQYWSLQNPISPGYASNMGMPGVKANFIMGGTLNPGASAIANEAAALGANTGGEMQLVTSPGGVSNLWFHMP